MENGFKEIKVTQDAGTPTEVRCTQDRNPEYRLISVSQGKNKVFLTPQQLKEILKGANTLKTYKVCYDPSKISAKINNQYRDKGAK